MRTIFLFILALSIVSCNAYTDAMPKKESVAPSARLPIDGTYIMSSNIERSLKALFGIIDVDKQRVRFEGGRAYYEESKFGKWGGSPSIEPGKVFLRDIKKVTPYRYKGMFYPLDKDTCFKVVLLVDGNNLKINLPPGKGLVKLDITINFEFLE